MLTPGRGPEADLEGDGAGGAERLFRGFFDGA
jgi:hypothetical protein